MSKGKKFVVLSKSAGFMGRAYAQEFDSKLEALMCLEKAYKDYRENKTDHESEPTIYIRLEPELLATIEFTS